LFQKSRLGLLSGDVSVNNETATEGEHAFSEWLKQSEIKTFEHVPNIEDFINTDVNLATSGVPTDDDIIDAVLQKEDSDEYSEETVPAKPLVTYSKAQDAVQMLMNFLKTAKQWATVHLLP
jgi:hypothetical protein